MSAATSSLAALRSALHQAWSQRSPREQQLLSLAAAVVLLAALWSLALAPAWRTWQEAPERQTRLDAQTQHMRQLQAQAKGLQKASPITRAEALQWLESSVKDLGPGAKIQAQGERATLRVEAAPAAPMARWLSQARERAQALPLQAQLQQTQPAAKGPASPASPSATAAVAPSDKAADVHWRGTVVLRLPGTP